MHFAIWPMLSRLSNLPKVPSFIFGAIPVQAPSLMISPLTLDGLCSLHFNKSNTRPGTTTQIATKCWEKAIVAKFYVDESLVL